MLPRTLTIRLTLYGRNSKNIHGIAYTCRRESRCSVGEGLARRRDASPDERVDEGILLSLEFEEFVIWTIYELKGLD